MQLGYTLPVEISNDIGIEQARVYVRA